MHDGLCLACDLQVAAGVTWPVERAPGATVTSPLLELTAGDPILLTLEDPGSRANGDAVASIDGTMRVWYGPEQSTDNHHRKGHRMAPRLLYKAEEAAEALGISRSKLYELLASGALESVHVDRSRRVPAQALEEFVERLRADAQPDQVPA